MTSDVTAPRLYLRVAMHGLSFSLAMLTAVIGVALSANAQDGSLRERLSKLPDENLADAIVEYVSEKSGNDERRAFDVLNVSPQGVRYIYATWWVDGEVNNGGFHQYFWNHGDWMADVAIAAYEVMGGNEYAAIMREATSIWRGERETMKSFQERGTLEAFSESNKHTRLGPLDERYYDLQGMVYRLQIDFIRNHPEKFDAASIQ